MKYIRKVDSITEIGNWFKENGLGPNSMDLDLILGKITINVYLKHYEFTSLYRKAKKFVSFLFDEIEFEKGQWCYFWDNDEDFRYGCITMFNGIKFKDSQRMYLSNANSWKNCISIAEYRERLKEYL